MGISLISLGKKKKILDCFFKKGKGQFCPIKTLSLAIVYLKQKNMSSSKNTRVKPNPKKTIETFI